MMKERGVVMMLTIPQPRKRDHICGEESIRKEIQKHLFGGSITLKIHITLGEMKLIGMGNIFVIVFRTVSTLFMK
jgi:hypothetical protein